MLRLRNEQFRVFQTAAVRIYEDRVVAHLQSCFPDKFASLGELAIRSVIRNGIKRAPMYGIISERDVCLYIDLMVQFGLDFDKHPLVSAILREQDETGTDKIDRLYSMALALAHEEYSQELRGGRGELF